MDNAEIDLYTFGNSDAAITLAKILSQAGYERCRKKAATKFREFCTIMKQLDKIDDISIRVVLSKLLMENARNSVKFLKIPEEVKSYLLNVMNAVYKVKAVSYRDMIVGERAKEQSERDLAKRCARSSVG